LRPPLSQHRCTGLGELIENLQSSLRFRPLVSAKRVVGKLRG
jgi:hypothetical protein